LKTFIDLIGKHLYFPYIFQSYCRETSS